MKKAYTKADVELLSFSNGSSVVTSGAKVCESYNDWTLHTDPNDPLKKCETDFSMWSDDTVT